MLQFLAENKDFHYNSSTPLAKISWSKLSSVQTDAKKDNKKMLYFFFRQYDDACCNMMRYPFDDYNQKKIIEKNFATAIVYDRSTPTIKNPQHITALINKYEVKSFPSLVSVDPKTGKFVKLGGTSDRNEIDDFLKKEVKE